MSKKLILMIAAGLLVSLLGCGDSSQKSIADPAASGILYVSHQATNSILRFDNGFAATGNTAPTATLNGSATLLSAPGRLLLDERPNRLFVINSGGSILVFDNARSKSGNVAPDRVIGIKGSEDLALDRNKDQLYVSSGSSVFVFAPASTINGNVAPSRQLSTRTNTIIAILLDQAHDRLFLAESAGLGTASIEIFENASQLAGKSIPSRTITGTNTGLANPVGLVLDDSDRLIVSDDSGSILIFPQASTVDGNVAPSSTITGSNTGLALPFQVALNRTNGDLYVADASASSVFVFNSSNPSSSNVAPTRTIAGSNTGFGPPVPVKSGPPSTVGIALDPTH